MAGNTLYLEDHIARKIESIDSKIKDLKLERLALERLLLDARREHASQTEAVRINSTKRILVENSILHSLRHSLKPMANKDLYANACRAVFDLKQTTFRSHIKRMKDAGKIVPVGNRWSIPRVDIKNK